MTGPEDTRRYVVLYDRNPDPLQADWVWLGVYRATSPRKAVKECRRVKASDGFRGKGHFRTIETTARGTRDVCSPKKESR